MKAVSLRFQNKSIMKVLVTGGAGYIGSVLVRQLLKKGYQVRALDSLKFGGDALYDVMLDPNFEFMKGDVRNAADVAKALVGIDAIAHLAAIVGDPACKNSAMKRIKPIGKEAWPYLKQQKKQA
jgi:nucleoside-diphosphate-sugar epimerase